MFGSAPSAPPPYQEVFDGSVAPSINEKVPPVPTHVVQPGHPTIVVAHAVQVHPTVMLGSIPVQCSCPYCHSLIVTRMEQSSGALAWIICVLLVIFGCWLGCCLIPFCISDLHNKQHFCPNCNARIGEYRPL